MAQISDVVHALAVLDAARQELAWAYSGDFTDVPEPMKGAVHTILEVLNEAEMRWMTSTREEEPMAAVVDKNKNGMAVVATGDGEKKKKKKRREDDVGVVKEVDTRSTEQAERRIRGWLVRLEEVACDMRAVAQKILLGGYSRSRIDDDKLSARWLPCLPRSSRAVRIARATDTVARNLKELKKQYDEEFGPSTGLPLATEQPAACSSAAGGQEAQGETRVISGDNVLVERNNDVKQRIIDIINGGISRRYYTSATILPIVGPPCVGKTTLVKSVFDECSSFGAGYKVWVDVRKGWSIKEIHEPIIDVLGRHHFPGMNDGENYIRKVKSEADYGRYIGQMLQLNKTRLLLVLDNLVVEEPDSSKWDQLVGFLDEYRKCVITILITRNEGLASSISLCSAFDTYRLHPCSDDMCWEIIKRTSGLDPEAIAAGRAVAVSEMDRREIARKCSGIPLAAKAIGRYLQSVDPQEWPGLIRDVWNIGGGFSRNSQQLRPLPIHTATVFRHLKRCSVDLGAESWLSLAYCAFVFPKGKGKGHGVITRDLLNQWCSLGITTRERGASCISELLDHSLILREEPHPDAPYASKAAMLLTMEDLMHDFARYHLGDRLIIVNGTDGAAPNNNKSSGACLALVSNFDAEQQLDMASILPAGILALRFEDCREMELREVEFASAKYACLRLLDLSGCSVKKLPHSIRHLKRLRYLKVPGIQDQVFPRPITGLYELRYLILKGSCQLKDLTEAFDRLSNLLHLDLSGCTGLNALPKSFGRLWRLEHLYLSACSGIEALPESFGWLRNLNHLDLSRCSGLKALPDSFRLQRLEHLDLSACSGLESLPNESFCWLRSLRHLNLAGCSGLQDLPTSFANWEELRHLDLSGLWRLHALPMVALPREMRHLNLSGCSGLQEALPDAPAHNELRHLDLSRLSSVCYLPISYAKLEKLVHLNLSGCSSLIKLPTVGGKAVSRWTRQLEHLDLSDCSQLTLVPSNSELQNLQYLDLSGCFRVPKDVSRLVEKVRRRGRASGPQDASLRGLGTNGTTN